jgi:hypothetical protein
MEKEKIFNQEKKFLNCPYCWTKNEVKMAENFKVGLFPYVSCDSKNSKDLNYHLKLAKGETEIIERKFLLEDILDRFSCVFG